MREACLLVAVLGCKAESLGVEVPKGGGDALSVEDLQRDAFLLEDKSRDRAPGTPRPEGGWRALEQRLQQMRAVPAFGRSYRATGEGRVICGRRDGQSDDAVAVVAVDQPERPAASTGAMALVISIAKAWDVRTPPERSVLFCVAEGAAGLALFEGKPPVPEAHLSGVVIGAESALLDGVLIEAAQAGGDVSALDFRTLYRDTQRVEGRVRALVTR